MQNVGKQIALALLLALATGCTENAEQEPGETQVPLAISVSSEAMTRADGTFVNGSFTVGKRVGVFGYVYDADTWQQYLQPNFFNNQPMTVADDASTPSLTYSPIKYWPSGDRKVSVYAYYPYSDDTPNIVPEVVFGMGSFVYTTPLNASNQYDFMVTPLLADKTSTDGTLNMEFYQVLACIEINVNLVGTDYKQIKDVRVTKLYYEGRFFPQVMTDGLKAGSDEWRIKAWPEASLTIDRKDMVVTGALPEGISMSATTTDIYKLLVIPQQCVAGLTQIRLTLVNATTDAEVTITHDLTEHLKAGAVYSYSFASSLP